MWRSTTQLWRFARGAQAALNASTRRIDQPMSYYNFSRRNMGLNSMLSCSSYRNLCTTNIPSHDKYTNEKSEPKRNIVRHALPEGIDANKLALYDLKGTAKGMRDIEGSDAVLGVHGRQEEWLPHGFEGHGAQGGLFAVFAAGGHQHKVSVGDIVYTNKIEGEVDSEYIFDQVLLVGAVDWSVFGRPLIGNAQVIATIEEQTQSGKIHVTKFKKRKGYRRKQGHRQLITRFRIDKIVFEFPSIELITPHKFTFMPKTVPVPNYLRTI